MSDKPKDLDQLRSEIRHLDSEVLKLMRQRLDLARQVGEVKRLQGLPIKNFKVEKEVIERAREQARGTGVYEELAADVAKLQIKYAVMTQEEDHSRAAAYSGDAKEILVVGGSGSMGQWLVKFFASFGHRVNIYDVSEPPTEEPNVKFFSDLSEASANADFICLATPILVTVQVIKQLAEMKPRGIVFDICSLKSPVKGPIKDALGKGLKITSVHPMFGPQTELLSGQNIVFCDTGDKSLITEVQSLFQDTTAHLTHTSLENHDELMGYVLGMSHILNLGFATAMEKCKFSFKELEAVASSTFRAQLDVVTPVINENQDLYYEIQSSNIHIKQYVNELLRALEAYLGTVVDDDRDGFKAYMEAARRFFDSSES